MFSVIPAVSTISVNNPAAQAANIDQVSQGLRTNDSEQLEDRSVSAPKEGADGQQVSRRNEEEDRQKRQTEDKISLQSQQNRPEITPEKAAQAVVSRSTLSVDIMA